MLRSKNIGVKFVNTYFISGFATRVSETRVDVFDPKLRNNIRKKSCR